MPYSLSSKYVYGNISSFSWNVATAAFLVLPELWDEANHDASVDQDTVLTTRPARRDVIEARRKLQQWLNPDEDKFSWGVLQIARTSDVTVIIVYVILE